jgi:signal peptidase II
MSSEREEAWRYMVAAAAIFMALDQASKQAVIHWLHRGEHRHVFFALDITNVRNTGVAFGALSGAGLVVLAITLIALAALLVYFGYHTTTPLLWLPVGVIAGGALGNLADRARQGAVTDFIDPVLWPAFNLADAGIVLGILGLLYVAERPRAKAAR